jgi:hypothetical protein
VELHVSFFFFKRTWNKEIKHGYSIFFGSKNASLLGFVSTDVHAIQEELGGWDECVLTLTAALFDMGRAGG